MGIAAGATATSIFSWIANDSFLSYPIGSPIMMSLFIVFIFTLLFYVFYDTKDPFHSLFKIGVVSTFISVILLYSHSASVEGGIREDLETEYIVRDFENTELKGDDDFIKPNLEVKEVGGGEYNPFRK